MCVAGAALQRAVLCNVHPDSSLSSNRFESLRVPAISQTISGPVQSKPFALVYMQNLALRYLRKSLMI